MHTATIVELTWGCFVNNLGLFIRRPECPHALGMHVGPKMEKCRQLRFQVWSPNS